MKSRSLSQNKNPPWHQTQDQVPGSRLGTDANADAGENQQSTLWNQRHDERTRRRTAQEGVHHPPQSRTQYLHRQCTDRHGGRSRSAAHRRTAQGKDREGVRHPGEDQSGAEPDAEAGIRGDGVTAQTGYLVMSAYDVKPPLSSNKKHVLHRKGCHWMGPISVCRHVGNHASCHGALRIAKRVHRDVNGCVRCAPACHKR